MSKRLIEYGMVGGLAMLCCAVLGCGGESGPSLCLSQVAPPDKPVRYLTVSEALTPLERPPARFDHDKHTRALEAEGCKACHGMNDRGDYLFSFAGVADQTGKKAVMNAFHDECIACHTRRAREGEKAGPVTCGECHVAPPAHGKREYLPDKPDSYEVLRDAYHTDCVACHREPSNVASQHAGPLDWRTFYAKQGTAEAAWPKVTFDYLRHDKHDKALEGKCELCHYLSPQRRAQLKAQGREPAGKDWVWDVDENNSLTERTAAHARCVNCHLRRKAERQKAGPTECGECHSGVTRSIAELADVPRPKGDQKDVMLIQLDELQAGGKARAKAVAFDHKSHVAKSRSCQECHHTTLRPCADCHTVGGSKKGNWITLAEAHHKATSTLSCVGCHEAEKGKADCAGCHQFLPRGLVQTGCPDCHTGSLDRLQKPAKLPAPDALIAKDTKEKIEIGTIEDQYKAATMPHLAIARKLTDISNQSSLASYYHTEKMTVCAGCHHWSPLEAKVNVPTCATCHTARREPGSGTPALLGAYHQRCLGCHRQMEPAGHKLPQTCTGCHEEQMPTARKE
ncbi:MAG: cytochrome c3 family protein [Pirellulales bacterium]